MNKKLALILILGFAFILQGCAVYPPYGSVSYNRYNSGYSGHQHGWRGHHGRENHHGWGGGGHRGWGGHRDHD